MTSAPGSVLKRHDDVSILCFWTTLNGGGDGGGLSVQAQTVPDGAAVAAEELKQLSAMWETERQQALARVDAAYLEGLKRIEEQAVAHGAADLKKAVAAQVAKVRAGHEPEVLAQAVETAEEEAQRSLSDLLTEVLADRVWRVDNVGEGLRWYFFLPDGRFARKSKVTNWVWRAPAGRWRLDEHGIVMVQGIGTTSQIRRLGNGTLVMSINRAGALSERPLQPTDLEYPGEGQP